MSKTLFVGGLAFTTSEKDLHQYFHKYGEIEKTNIVKDRRTRASKGYGFVFYVEEASVEQVLSEKPHRIRGRQVDCQAAKKKSEKNKYKEMLSKTRIFVTCLTPNINNKDMNHFFTQFGPVKSAYVIRDPDTERSLGFGFVIFEKPQDAQKTVKNPNLWLKGTKINCDTYKENDENTQDCFDPVGKRMKKLNTFKRKPNKKRATLATTIPQNGASKSKKTSDLKRRVSSSNSGNGSKPEEKKKRGVGLFGYDEEELQKEEKLLMIKSFQGVQQGVMKYSHMFGGNLRLNSPYKDGRRRRNIKRRQMKQILKMFTEESSM